MRRYGPFAQTSPNGLTSWVSDSRRPIPDHLRLMLGHLDGVEKFTYVIWRGSNPESIIVTHKDPRDSFMQAAGTAEAMTVEARIPGPDGNYHLYTVGRPEPADGTTTLMNINETRAVRVNSNEVFTADEAATIFYTYYLTESVAQPYVLRELDLSQDLSEER